MKKLKKRKRREERRRNCRREINNESVSANHGNNVKAMYGHESCEIANINI
jgi:hypothetical protein